ncbi:MAG: hypothetical protein RLZZ450_7406 [Pseudomonadota bacterium]
MHRNELYGATVVWRWTYRVEMTMNNKLLGFVFGGVLTFGCVAAGCSDTDDTASATESALKGGKKGAGAAAVGADGGLAPCSTKAKKPKHDAGAKVDDGDDESDEADSDEESDEGAGDGGLGKGNGKGKDKADGGGKPDGVGGGKPDDVGGGKADKGDAGHGKSGDAKVNKDKGGKKCLEDDGTVADEDEDEDESDASTHGKSDEAHGKGDDAHGKSDEAHGKGKNADAGA